MKEQKKKIITVVSIIGIALLLVILIVVIVNNKEKEKNTETFETVNLSELINIEGMKNIPYETKETEEELSTKYITSGEKCEVKANVQAGETEGKMIYVRGAESLNVYKTEYVINKYEDKTTEVNKIMQEFEMVCEGYMEITEEYKETEQLYGESTESFERPVEESIYYEERLYSKTYKDEEKEYDINFYKKDNRIICEFVRVY